MISSTMLRDYINQDFRSIPYRRKKQHPEEKKHDHQVEKEAWIIINKTEIKMQPT
jgi:hypothetical protein